MFKGLITESRNWDCATYMAWWDVVDVIGVDAYYQNVTWGTTVEEMVKQWSPILDDLGALSISRNKPLIFSEVGYCSGDCDRDHKPAPLDFQLHARHYEAIFQATADRKWFHGAFWWNWVSDPRSLAASDEDDCLTPQFKSAEDTLRLYYHSTLPKTPTPSGSSQCLGFGKCTA